MHPNAHLHCLPWLCFLVDHVSQALGWAVKATCERGGPLTPSTVGERAPGTEGSGEMSSVPDPGPGCASRRQRPLGWPSRADLLQIRGVARALPYSQLGTLEVDVMATEQNLGNAHEASGGRGELGKSPAHPACTCSLLAQD